MKDRSALVLLGFLMLAGRQPLLAVSFVCTTVFNYLSLVTAVMLNLGPSMLMTSF